ncbi:hypothetical protein [Streptomyces sp. NPDC050548]|uniref:hypothetical protein n=1 Tax=Streptomyces sp. NPDC050548 TaxID=3365629 RepID=UPI003795B9F1
MTNQPVFVLGEDPAKDDLSFAFGSITYHLGPGRAAAFAASLPALPGLAEKLEALPAKGYNGWPSVALTALAAEPAAVEGILSAIQQLVDDGSGDGGGGDGGRGVSA